MVSPSKLQQQPKQQLRAQHCHRQQQQLQQHKINGQLTTGKTIKHVIAQSGASPASPATASIVKIQRGPKPLEKNKFYLDIKNHGLSAKLESRIKELGGGIELFLVKAVTLVITDRSNKPAQQTTNDRCKWGYTSGGSGGPPSLRSIEVQTPTPTPPTPYHSIEGPLSNSTNQRGQPTQRSKSRVDAMLERALTQPQQCSVDPLNNALNWGIPIWTTCELQSWLEKITVSLKTYHNLKSDGRVSSGKDFSVKHLKEPYIKFESYQRNTRPAFIELQSWPTINSDGDPGSCPFDIKRREKKEIISVKKEIKENREKYCNSNISKGKDMTRRPRATATRARKTENTGYCEICRIEYRNLTKHLQSDQHLSFVRNDKNFISLDNLISTGASVEAFLTINRSKDVRKDCSLFSSHDHCLDNGILSADEKSEKNDKSDLNDFGIEEMKMMECNGARRNLNLDSPHNLRARTKHESGHLLRSKGRPFSEVEKSEKSLEKYVIMKRSKGTIWIEENSSEDEKDLENEETTCEKKPSFDRLCDVEVKTKSNNREVENMSMNGDVDPETIVDCKRKESSTNRLSAKENALRDCFLETQSKTKVNGYERKEDKRRLNEGDEVSNGTKQEDDAEVTADCENHNIEEHNNGEHVPAQECEDKESLKNFEKEDKGKSKSVRRGMRTMRGRHRLSVEERLIEDNRDYYKVEVLGNKLRSSAIPSSNAALSPSKDLPEKSRKDDKPSSEKPVVVRFKRVRKSELTLLSDEAESFMFGEPRRDDDSGDSDGEQSSILPKDTESDREDPGNSLVISSSPAGNVKQEVIDDDSQDSCGRAKKRRRTQTEALLKDNNDYYKFETPGSRLRYQAPLTGISEPLQNKESTTAVEASATQEAQKVYPSRPSPEIEKMHFSFEAIPRSEPWYQTYQRQDEGEEFYYFSETDSHKPFLLPYEIENFEEILRKSIQNGIHRKKGRSKGSHGPVGSRTPRKSPRCHASTLAIMSTIIRRKEQLASNLNTVEEETKPKSSSETAKPDKKVSDKSDIDEDLKEMARNIDDMINNRNDDMNDLDSFEQELMKNSDEHVLETEVEPKGAPINLLELLENCHDAVPINGMENSSCASSDCGELGSEFPSKRRKKRKNKTGWPGNKMRRKLHIKHLNEDLHKESNDAKKIDNNSEGCKPTAVETLEDVPAHVSYEDEEVDPESETGKENEQVQSPKNSKKRINQKAKSGNKKVCRDVVQNGSEIKDTEDPLNKTMLKLMSGDKISSKKKRSVTSDKVKLDEEEVEEVEEVEEKEENVETFDVKPERHSCIKGRSSSISENSEESLSNNENICAKNTNSPKKEITKKLNRQRQRKNTTSSETSLQGEVENCQYSSSVGSSPRKRKRYEPESQEHLAERHTAKKSKARSNANRKRRKNEQTPSKVVLENKNCKKKSPPSANERRRHKRSKRNDSVSSELANGDMSDRLSLVSTSDVDQRRSSIDFQPVVRVTKIDDPTESNRRLRSSSSPRSSKQPAKKRIRHSSGRR